MQWLIDHIFEVISVAVGFLVAAGTAGRAVLKLDDRVTILERELSAYKLHVADELDKVQSDIDARLSEIRTDLRTVMQDIKTLLQK